MHTNGLPCGVLFASPLRHSCGVYILMQLTKDGRKFSNLIVCSWSYVVRWHNCCVTGDGLINHRNDLIYIVAIGLLLYDY